MVQGSVVSDLFTDQDRAAPVASLHLNEIRTKAIGCSYRIPAPQQGALDFQRVNVEQRAGNGTRTLIGNVTDARACHPVRGGWYYDVDPAAGTPRTITLCEASCAALRADAGARLDIVLGCKTSRLIE